MPCLHRRDDLARLVRARQHVGVGHARHRHVGVAFAPSVAGRLHAHQARVLPVLHVADQDAVLDQHGAAGRRALVVDRERAAPLRDRPVVHHGDALGGDPLAHQAGEGRCLLAVEVAFEAVPDRLVQHDAGPAGSEHHVHLARRRRHRREVDQAFAHRLVHRAVPLAGGEEVLVALASAIAFAAGLLAVAFADHHGDVDPHQRAHVAIDLAVGAHDLHHLPSRSEAHRHLAHARVPGPRIGVDLFEQPHLGLEARLGERVVVAVEAGIGAPAAPRHSCRNTRPARRAPHPPRAPAPPPRRRTHVHSRPLRP